MLFRQSLRTLAKIGHGVKNRGDEIGVFEGNVGRVAVVRDPAEAVFDLGDLLCVRPYLRADMVSISPDHEKQMLYHLPYIQLGSSHDVYSHDVHRQLLYKDASHFLLCNMGNMGIVCHDVSGKILGSVKHLPEMLGMHR